MVLWSVTIIVLKLFNPEKIEIYITAVTRPPAAHVDIVIFSKLAVQTYVLNGQNLRDARYSCPGL